MSEKEARVYLYALELGATTADKLAKHAKVNRSTTYVQLESLMKNGLIRDLKVGDKTLITVTEKGRDFFVKYAQMREFEKTFGL